MQEQEYIEVYGARVHNLKNIDVRIPRDSLTVITGLSGSGKSSLAFDRDLLRVCPEFPGQPGASGCGQDYGA